MKALRLVFAGLFVFGSMLVTAVVVGEFQSGDEWPWWASLAPAAAMLVAIGIVLQFFNPRGQRLTDAPMTVADRIRLLEAAGLVDRRKFSAGRCFAVEESEDEGLCYYLQLNDGGTLCLNGQYLYDYGRSPTIPS